MKRPNHYSQIAAIAIAALALSHAPSFADNEQVEAYQMTVVAKNGAKQSVVLVKPDVATGPKYYTKSKELSINGKLYAISDIQSFRIVTLTGFTLHFSCCFTKLLHSLFITLLNNFTMQEKCY